MMIDLPDRIAAILRILDDARVFDIANGSATLNFDADGTLTQVETNVVSYKRKRVIPTSHKLLVVQRGDIL